MAVSVIVAVDPVGDKLVDKIAERARALRIGPGDEPKSEMGPLITEAHRDKVASYVPQARQQGAEVVVDGTDFTVAGQENGFFLGVSLLDKVTRKMDAYRDEIFGPVLSVVRVGSYEEALALMNSSPWGNGTAIFTKDGGAARRFRLEVQTGMVGVNVPIPVPIGYHAFGGWKDSLYGEHGMYGTEGVHFYTRGKSITTRWPDPSDGGIDLGFPQT